MIGFQLLFKNNDAQLLIARISKNVFIALTSFLIAEPSDDYHVDDDDTSNA